MLSLGQISLKSRTEHKALSEIIIPRLKYALEEEKQVMGEDEKGNEMKTES